MVLKKVGFPKPLDGNCVDNHNIFKEIKDWNSIVVWFYLSLIIVVCIFQVVDLFHEQLFSEVFSYCVC